VPYRIDENVDLMKRCGYSIVDAFFRWYNFAAFIAIKE
jgi:tRNA (cmo5U34)-methyltransferase